MTRARRPNGPLIGGLLALGALVTVLPVPVDGDDLAQAAARVVATTRRRSSRSRSASTPTCACSPSSTSRVTWSTRSSSCLSGSAAAARGDGRLWVREVPLPRSQRDVPAGARDDDDPGPGHDDPDVPDPERGRSHQHAPGIAALPTLVGGFGLFLSRQFMATLPDEMLEAARLDGAGEWRIFLTIVLPMSSPILAVLAC